MLEADVKLAQQYRAFWRDVFSRLGVAAGAVDELSGRASRNGTDILSELRASGRVADRILYRAIAAEIDIQAEETVDPERIEASEATCVKLLGNRTEIAAIRYSMRSLDMGVMLSPWRLSTGGLAKMNARGEVAKSRLRLVSPRIFRPALAERARGLLSRIACSGLAERWPRFSARTVAVAWQGAFFGALAISLMVGLIQARGTTMVAIHVVASLLFLSCVLLRCLAALEARPPAPIEPERRLTPDMPTYTIVVALYREAAIVPDLLAALGKIFWPRSKLQVKLVCEEDDHATLAALEALPLRSVIEIIRVPPVGPRTKPKALAYALPFCSGEFLALYDAEDRPHPMQLVEAWEAFRKADGDLACVQAPLVVANSRESLVARSFAFEYAALFRGLLPWLASRNLVLPLGGTSNHFRRETLEEVGGWDPYNVTEDADLGLRLGRFGYRTGLIELPTLEEGPHRWPIWLRQRTRWFKGWMQTWLVHMRNPAALWRDLGWRSFLVFQVLFTGMIASALVHPFFVGTLLWLGGSALLGNEPATYHSALISVDIVNILLGYLGFLMLGRQTLAPRERKGFWRVALFTPVYWLMMSLAAWRAFGQLFARPHEWEKTPHRPRRRSVAAKRHQPEARNSDPSRMMSGSSRPIAASSLPA